jgi:hypothetical protein
MENVRTSPLSLVDDDGRPLVDLVALLPDESDGSPEVMQALVGSSGTRKGSL